MLEWNLWSVWVGFLIGMIAGAAQGLFFHREDWFGGYGSWRRRLLRLGHISFFGLGLVNLAFVLTARALELPFGAGLPALARAGSICLIAGAALMPLVCYLAAWRPGFRSLFFLPVLSLLVGAASVLTLLLGSFQP